MNTFRLLSDEQQEEITEMVRDFLPERAELAVLSYTGSRAFGWGREDSSDIDVHGMFVTENDQWFYKCHTRDLKEYDVTVKNVYSFDEPEYDRYRWKQYYDMSNPFYINDKFDYYEDFMDHVCPEKVHNIYPYDVNMQRSRYDNGKTARNACHTYKEYLIPLNYLWYDEIETNVVEINQKSKFQLDGLDDAVTNYKFHSKEINNQLIESDFDWLHKQLGEALPEEEFKEEHRQI